jgi:hypothetical protein
MKRYFFSLMALALAIGAVSFTNANQSTKNFKFIGNAAVQSEVNDPHKWQEVTTLTCNNVDVQACGILSVNSAFYHVPAGQTLAILNNTFDGGSVETISSSLNVSTYFVTAVTSGTKRNKN